MRKPEKNSHFGLQTGIVLHVLISKCIKMQWKDAKSGTLNFRTAWQWRPIHFNGDYRLNQRTLKGIFRVTASKVKATLQ